MRRRVALVLLALALALAWRPLLQPAGRATVLLLDLFSGLVGADLAAVLAPEPRVREGRATFAGTEMRVTTWEPGLGDRHPAMLVLNGATPVGNDNAATRELGRALARAGFLATLPEFPFLREGRFDPGAMRQVDAAFSTLRARADVEGERSSAFGSSVGGGVLLAAAGGPHAALARADALVVLGGYFDLDTYLASVAAGAEWRGAAVVPWLPAEEARERLPRAALDAVPPAERAALADALEGGSYEAVLVRLRALPAGSRAVLDGLSPRASWATLAPPVFWIHDPDDAYEPLAEAEAAAAAPRRSGTFRLAVPALVKHAEVAPGARGRGPLEVAGELLGLLGFAIEVMRHAG